MEPLISAEDLDPEAVTLLDVRWQLATGSQPGLYAGGHIPGAVFVDLDRDLAAPPGPEGRHPLPRAEDFQLAMRAAGVRDGAPVVVYDDANGLPAARAWWLLRYFGHEQVALLDGGLSAWLAAGRPLADGDETPQYQGDFTARPGAMPVLDADGAARLAAHRGPGGRARPRALPRRDRADGSRGRPHPRRPQLADGPQPRRPRAASCPPASWPMRSAA